MQLQQNCAECGAPILANAGQTLCPKCLLGLGLEAGKQETENGGRRSEDSDQQARELTENATPETLFEQQWASTVLDRVLIRLRDEYTAAGKQALFEKLQNCLPGAHSEIQYAELAAAFGMTEAAVRMAAHRLRKRYGELLRAEIAVTVSRPGGNR